MKEYRDIRQYEDMINLPHHQSKTRPRMSNQDRAAQFSPFAALTGYNEAIKETARLTDRRMELDETAKEALNRKLWCIRENLGKDFSVTVTYFEPDARKAGGAYRTVSGRIKKLDEYRRTMVFIDGTIILLEEISGLESKIFAGLEETGE